LRYLRDNNIKIIHTYRRNKLKQAIAVLGNRKRITINKEKFKLKLNSIEKKIKEFETRNIQLIEWFDNNNYDYMKIVYEDLTGDKHINEMDVREIKEFLGVDIPDVIPVRTKKNTFTKVKDNLINYKEILDGISTD
jgi:LPS sulfotransferase NodH